MKKRQLAYSLVVVSILTNVSYANDVMIINNNEDKNKLVEEINKLLQVKYTDEREGNVYEVKADDEIITDTYDLNLKMEKYAIDDKILDIEIIDKGHKMYGESISSKDYSRYDRYETSEELYDIYINHKNEKPIKYIEPLDEDDLITTEPTKVEKVLIKLLNEDEIEIVKGSDKLDFTNHIDVNGNKVDLSDVEINTPNGLSIAKAVKGFAKCEELGYLKEFDIPSKVIGKYKIANDVILLDKNLSEFYNGSYSENGVELINSLANRKFYNNGYRYNIAYDLIDGDTDEKKSEKNVSKIIYKDGSYSFEIDMRVVKDTTKYLLQGTQNFSLNIYSDNQVKLKEFRNEVIDAIINSDKEISNAQFDLLGGRNRFYTSVEVSKEYTKINNTNGVVLVGQDAIIDGLSAVPFAKYRNSPILLSNKNEVPTVVMDEIKRIFYSYDNVDTIYIIGGKNVISDDVTSQLVSELGHVRVVRIDGKDRYETSLNISKRMDLDSTDKAYVVSGFGEADAMSVAPLAANYSAPIIVTKKGGLSDDAKEFFEVNDSIVDVDVIGGTSKISTEVLKDVKEAGESREVNKAIDISRVYGNNRLETNANILKLYQGSYDKIVVAKDGMKDNTYLVDALSAGVLGYPMVLGSDDLAENQVNSIEQFKNSRLIEVGYNVSDNVINKILKAIKSK